MCLFQKEKTVILVFTLFSDRVAIGRALDLPVYFGDAGSREVTHIVSEVLYTCK